ncbi:MAG: N-acetyl-gamma-glutamyl-phosphate reductase [bacterium]
MISVAIAGVTGYTGQQLFRLLHGHPDLCVTQLFAHSSVGQPLAQLCPELAPIAGTLDVRPFVPSDIQDCDLLFLALPHGCSHAYMAGLLKKGIRVIDLSADFRFEDVSIFNQTYDVCHEAPELLSQIPYVLPELYEADLQEIQAAAVPGCYATASLLALTPLCRAFTELGSIVIDAKSGVSGAGKGPTASLQFCEIEGAFSAYATGTHRHEPEIAAMLGHDVFFSPHLLPMSRGILLNCYVMMPHGFNMKEIQACYKDFYGAKPFVRFLAQGQNPNTKWVTGSNGCMLGFSGSSEKGVLVIHAMIDNLIKGASGQAMQIANRFFGFDETVALPVCPQLL